MQWACRNKVIYFMFVFYLASYLVILQPVQEVRANPLAIIAGQVARKVFQKAAQQVGIAIMTRAGVKFATGNAAKKASKAWFQRSTYAAQNLSKAKKVGTGTMPGWQKVLLGGATGLSLVGGTVDICQDIKGIVDGNNGYIVNGKEGTVQGQNSEYTASQGTVIDPLLPEGLNIDNWKWDVPTGLNMNGSTNINIGWGEFGSSLIKANTPFVYIPNNTPVGFRFNNGLCIVYGGVTEVVHNGSYWETRYECIASLLFDDGTVSRKDIKYPYSGSICSPKDSVNYDKVMPVLGFVCYKNPNLSSELIIEAVKPPTGRSARFIGFPGSLALYSGALPEFTPEWEELGVNSLTLETVPDGNANKPLVIQVPDPDYFKQQNPGMTEEELEQLIIDTIRNNPDVVNGAETEEVQNPDALPDYFPPEAVDPPTVEEPTGDYSGFFGTIIDYLRKIWDALNPENMVDKIQAQLNGAYDNIAGKFEWYGQAKSAVISVTESSVADDDWDGIWINHPTWGNLCVVDPRPTNTYKNDIRRFIGASVIFLTLLVTIRKVSTILGGDD